MIHFEVWPQAKIDYEPLANGLLDIIKQMPDDYQAALAIGMLPAPIMELLKKALTDKLITICCINHDMEPTPENMSMFSLEKERFNDIMHKITSRILKQRPVKLA